MRFPRPDRAGESYPTRLPSDLARLSFPRGSLHPKGLPRTRAAPPPVSSIALVDATRRPRAHADPAVIAAHRGHVSEKHVAPLNTLASEIARATGLDVPMFDPTSGGTCALALLLLESPGPASTAALGSGFVSPHNDDPTAEHVIFSSPTIRFHSAPSRSGTWCRGGCLRKLAPAPSARLVRPRSRRPRHGSTDSSRYFRTSESSWLWDGRHSAVSTATHRHDSSVTQQLPLLIPATEPGTNRRCGPRHTRRSLPHLSAPPRQGNRRSSPAHRPLALKTASNMSKYTVQGPRDLGEI